MTEDLRPQKKIMFSP